MDIRYELDAAAFEQALSQAPEMIADELETALLESCKILQGRARAVHRFRTRSGAIERSVMFETYREETEAEVAIDPRIAKHGVYQHTGTGKYGPKGKPYDIFPKNKKMLRFATSPGTARYRRAPYGRFHEGGTTFAYGVTHPGVKPDPFLYNAADATQGQINACFDRAVGRITASFGR